MKAWRILTINDFFDDFCQSLSKLKMEILKKSLKILQNFGKLANFFGDLKSITNYLPFETNPRVLAQLVEKWQAVKDSYFQVQKKVKKQKRPGQKSLVYFKEARSLNKKSDCHEILHAKSADQDFFRSFFQKLIWRPTSRDMSILYVTVGVKDPVDGEAR